MPVVPESLVSKIRIKLVQHETWPPMRFVISFWLLAVGRSSSYYGVYINQRTIGAAAPRPFKRVKITVAKDRLLVSSYLTLRSIMQVVRNSILRLKTIVFYFSHCWLLLLSKTASCVANTGPHNSPLGPWEWPPIAGWSSSPEWRYLLVRATRKTPSPHLLNPMAILQSS